MGIYTWCYYIFLVLFFLFMLWEFLITKIACVKLSAAFYVFSDFFENFSNRY